MIIREQGDQLLLIRQTDHAFLAGFLAKEWGNDEFPRPEPFESFCLAVGEHDNGWAEWELQPSLDEKSRMPYSFMSVPTDEHIGLYQRGIEHTVLAQYLLDFLSHTEDADLRMATAELDAAARQELTTTVAVRLHATTQFETTEDRNLRVVIDDSVVREAFLTLRERMR